MFSNNLLLERKLKKHNKIMSWITKRQTQKLRPSLELMIKYKKTNKFSLYEFEFFNITLN